MIDSMIASLLNFFLWLISLFLSIVTLPLNTFILGLNYLFNLDDYIDIVKDFLTDYVFTGFAFCLETICQCTHISRDLLSVIAIMTTTLFAFSISSMGFRLFLHVLLS